MKERTGRMKKGRKDEGGETQKEGRAGYIADEEGRESKRSGKGRTKRMGEKGGKGGREREEEAEVVEGRKGEEMGSE